MRKLLFAMMILAFIAPALPVNAETPILPHRVIDCKTHTVIDFEGLLARCSDAAVVTLGENHDDPATHQVELAVLEGLFRVHGKVIFSMEMFERDVQALLDDYLAGNITEEEFLAGSRPWGNYETDYRPMVEFAKENGLRVIASNVPRRLAKDVSMGGFGAVEFSDEDKFWVAKTFEAPEDDYYKAFAAVMSVPEASQSMGVTPEMLKMFYEAQVIKDETMAESVALAYESDTEAVVYHIAGNFHLMDFLGSFSRIKRDLPGKDVVSIIVVPVDDLFAPVPEDAPKADYWILVQAPEMTEEPAEEMAPMPAMPPSTGSGSQ